ncbi:DUF58 domain-containing protein [Ideonella sp.]|uniref:DUF58 domain-containing protein n=1 Tax=Ideonella sp. TaxID=1929293 RepID=UPI002B4A6CFD|nr:DUF58 domain-containing protein [Ideonella sp.]HJV70066.1 DUF58 domain-containing protein [Ideonella sp.]
MLAWLRHRWDAWWEARQRPAEQWRLSQRNIYIVPTRAGFAFGLTLLLLLVASINYQLSLGYALTFLLAGSALASMHMTHNSLRGLTLHARAPVPVFAGDRATLELVVTNPGAARHGLGFGVQVPGVTAQLAFAEIGPAGQSSVSVGWLAERRGLHALPLLRIESRFPFGLFRAWSLWRPAGQLCVYPKPEQPAAALPAAAAVAGGPVPLRSTAQGGEFDGLRPWRRGDTLRQVAWKKVARSGELVSREGRESARRELWLDWSQARQPDTESRLSRLAAWVLLAERQGLAYGLRLPGLELPPADGAAHRHAALGALAAWS